MTSSHGVKTSHCSSCGVEFRLNMDSALEDAAGAEGEYARDHDGEYTKGIPVERREPAPPWAMHLTIVADSARRRMSAPDRI